LVWFKRTEHERGSQWPPIGPPRPNKSNLNCMWIDPLVGDLRVSVVPRRRLKPATPSGHRGRWVRSTAMDRFVRCENIKRYRKLLREVKDEAGRRLIRKLLLEEEQKEVPIQKPSPLTARSRYRWC
jgi:hypothetical protein